MLSDRSKTLNTKPNKEQTTLTLDPTVKAKGVQVLNELGLSLSTFVDISLRQVARERRLPFTPDINPERPLRRLDAVGLLAELDQLRGQVPQDVANRLRNLSDADAKRLLEERDA